MSYTKQNWNTGDTITADKLNHMEDGIGGGYDFALKLDSANEVLEAYGLSYSQLVEKITNFEPVTAFYTNGQYVVPAQFSNYTPPVIGTTTQLWFEFVYGQDSDSLYLFSDGGGEYKGDHINWTYDSATQKYTFTGGDGN